MKATYHLILFAALFGLLLAGSALLAASPASAAPAILASDANLENETIRAPLWITITCLDVSNEAHGYLVNALIAQGYGDQNFLQVLGYLKTYSNGIISDAFYNKVASAPASSDVFVHLNDYSGGSAGVSNGFKICDDGLIWPSSLSGRVFAGFPGWGLAPGQNRLFTLSYALDPSHNHRWMQIGTNLYYTFAIAWWDPKAIFLPLMTRN